MDPETDLKSFFNILVVGEPLRNLRVVLRQQTDFELTSMRQLLEDLAAESPTECSHLVEIYKDIFLAPGARKQDEEIPHENDWIPIKCVRKYRTVFRKWFRGAAFLSMKDLYAAHNHACKEALNHFETFTQLHENPDAWQKMEVDLNSRLIREFARIIEINEWKRETIFQEMKADALKEFENLVRTELPLLFLEDNQKFYGNEQELITELKMLVSTTVMNIMDEVPFETDEKILTTLGSQLKTELEQKVVVDLILKNSEKIALQGKLLCQLVADLVKSYREEISGYLETHPMATSTSILESHNAIKNSHFQKIQEECLEAPEFHVEFLNFYNNKTFEILKEILTLTRENAEKKLKEFEEKASVEVGKFLDAIHGESGSYLGLSPNLKNVRTVLKKQLDNLTESTRAESLVANRNFEEVLRSARPMRLQSLEKGSPEAVMDKLKHDFRNRVNAILSERCSRALQEFRVENTKHLILETLKQHVVFSKPEKNRHENAAWKNLANSMLEFMEGYWNQIQEKRKQETERFQRRMSLRRPVPQENSDDKGIRGGDGWRVVRRNKPRKSSVVKHDEATSDFDLDSASTSPTSEGSEDAGGHGFDSRSDLLVPVRDIKERN